MSLFYQQLISYFSLSEMKMKQKPTLTSINLEADGQKVGMKKRKNGRSLPPVRGEIISGIFSSFVRKMKMVTQKAICFFVCCNKH